MIEKFWESLATRLADRWSGVAFPALAFWIVVALAWSWDHGGISAISARLNSLGAYSAVAQTLIVAAGLLIVVGSVALVDRLTTFVVPILTGRWPSWTRRLSDSRSMSFRRQYERLEADWLALTKSESGQASDEFRIAELDDLLRRFPVPPERIMPTRFGNVLRAIETRSEARTGLSLSIMLPRLLLVIPDSARKDVSAAWAATIAPASVMVWSVLLAPFAIWCPFVLIAVPLGIAVGWWWLPERAEAYADLLESTLDVYRAQLYEALRWPMPTCTETEHANGKSLSQYLLRGTAAIPVNYRDTPQETEWRVTRQLK